MAGRRRRLAAVRTAAVAAPGRRAAASAGCAPPPHVSSRASAGLSLLLQVGVFSATLPPEALEITRKFMNKPVRILVKRDELTLEVGRERLRLHAAAAFCMPWAELEQGAALV